MNSRTTALLRLTCLVFIVLSPTTAWAIDSGKYRASLQHAVGEINFPLQESYGKLFHSYSDFNGDGVINVEDALENIVEFKIATSVTGTSSK
ncbi:MAG: hypothetical protein M5U22_14260 [Thermoleophilia bacterium]|nr:hypothetical protein [Thermoleophilia bacterium]